MIAIPYDLETQITHLAEYEHTDTTTLLSRMVKVYQSLNIQRTTSDNVQEAFASSLLEFDELYSELAK